MNIDCKLHKRLSNMKFTGDFIKENEGLPSHKNSFPAKDGWVLYDPKQALRILNTWPEDELTVQGYRDGGTIMVCTTYDEFVFLYAKPSDKPDFSPFYQPYALHRFTKEHYLKFNWFMSITKNEVDIYIRRAKELANIELYLDGHRIERRKDALKQADIIDDLFHVCVFVR